MRAAARRAATAFAAAVPGAASSSCCLLQLVWLVPRLNLALLLLPACLPSVPCAMLLAWRAQITEYLDPIITKKTTFAKPPPAHSAFLDGFFGGAYSFPTGK